jgi:trehalose 6-phosphate phosphatase
MAQPAALLSLPDRAALLLDLDGTLLDIAPTPAEVVVPPGLSPMLRSLRARLGEALAVVSGRPVEEVEALLGDAPYAIAGEHGAAVRRCPGGPLERPPLAEVPPAWLAAAAGLAAATEGVLLERKSHGFVLHYRRQPAAGPALREALAAILGARSALFTIMPAHMAWEVKPTGVDKGVAVRGLMERPPFVGRTPVYVGDDVTDEDGLRAACQLGGIGYRVGEAFGDAAGVRAWLAGLAAPDRRAG